MTSPFQFTADDLEIIERSAKYEGFFRVDEIRFKHKLFEGGWSGEVVREVFERGDAVVVLPFDVARDQIIMLEQVRIGTMLNSDKPWMLELVGGMVEQGESVESVAMRETEEEAGLQPKRLMPMTHYLSSAGGTTERITIFLGEVDASQAAEIAGLEYENEDIKVHKVARQQALAWLEDGTIENAATIIALQWLQLNLDKVRNAWR